MHVGNRIRERRKHLHVSQQRLGEKFGLTFQQVQKYEKGTNRVGASRLQTMCTILEVPVSYFFDGTPQAPPSSRAKVSEDVSTEAIAKFIKSADSEALIRAFSRIKAPNVRRSIVQMVKAIGDARSS